MSAPPRYFNRSPKVFLMAVVALFGGISSSAADLSDGLVGYWSFDEGEGDTAYDYSGYGNHGTILGATWTAGLSGNALYFDGLDAYVNCGNGDSLKADTLTVAAWVRPEGKVGQQVIIDHRHGGGYNLRFHGADYPLGICWLMRLSDGSEEYVYVPGVVDNGVWQHVVGTYDGTYLRIYRNGSLVAACNVGPLSLNSAESDLLIGRYVWLGSPDHYCFEGTIDEVRIYNRALSADEIADLYWSVFPDPQDDTTDGDKSDVSGTSNDPVNTATGSFFHQETDLSIPSRGSPLIFTRFYNSKAAAPGRKVGRSGQTVAAGRRTATSQPAITKDAERSSVRAEKPDESPVGKEEERADSSSQARLKAKENSK